MIINKLTKKQEEALKKARQYFEYSSNHPSMIKWREKAIEDYGFYDGTKQWPEHILRQLKERNQDAVTVNKIKNLVNYMSGMEVQTRFRAAFRSHSGKEEEDLLAKALTHLGYAIQENQDISYKSSLKFKDALITGVGWSNIYRDSVNGEIKYDYIDPLNVYYDPDDLTPTMGEMSFVARVRWMSIEKAKELWYKNANYFNSLFSDLDSGGSSPEIEQKKQVVIDSYTAGDGTHGSKIMIVEVQYRETKESYCSWDVEGRPFQTFDKEEAEKLKGKGNEIEKKNANQIMRVVYTGDELLEYAPLDPLLPDLLDFTYIPVLWTRRHEDGVPDGWISVMKDIQRELNYRRTKLVNNLNSFHAVVDGSAIGPGKDIEEIRAEIKRPDSVIIKSGVGEIKVDSNQPLANGQFEMLSRGDQELQQVSGIYDEALGKETNAVSGVAIKNRQTNSVRNQVFAFDNLRMMKKREARMMLALIQGGGDEFLEAHILTDEEKKTILLNVVREINGKKIILNDIRTLPLSIYVEEVPDFESSSQEQQAQLEALLNNPQASMILQSPVLMKRLGIRDYQDLAEDMKRIMEEQNKQENPEQQGAEQPEQPQEEMLQPQEMPR